jgi:hypothetical protein
MEENIACEYYSRELSFNQLMDFVNASLYTMVYNDSAHNWGHRDSLMDPTNNMVGISFTYDENHAFLVIHMIKEWVVWENPPEFADGVFSCSGNWSVPGQSVDYVYVEYSDPSQYLNVTYSSSLELNETGQTYSPGVIVGGVVPEPFHFNSIQTIRPLSWNINTGNMSNSHFDFSFNLKPFKGTGVYTVVIWGTRPYLPLDPFDSSRYSDGFPILEYSVFLSNGTE